MVASTLGLADFPGRAERRAASSRSIMGVVVLAWLTRHPIGRWGEAWASTGTMRMRYLEHLDAGAALDVRVEEAAELGLEITDAAGRRCSTGTAGLASPEETALSPAAALLDASAPGPVAPVPPLPGSVDGLVLRPLVLPFRADRDLAFVDELTDGPWWQERSWAHPAWVASGANEVLVQSIAFADGGYWRHAGSELRHLRPVATGSELRFHGRVERTFQGANHRFAVARIVVTVDEQPAAEHLVTFVYGAALPMT